MQHGSPGGLQRLEQQLRLAQQGGAPVALVGGGIDQQILKPPHLVCDFDSACTLDGGDAGGHGLHEQAKGVAPRGGHRPRLAPIEADDHAPGLALAPKRGAHLCTHPLCAQVGQPPRLGRAQCGGAHDPGISGCVG